MGAPAGVCKMIIGDEGFPYGVSIFKEATAYRGCQITPPCKSFEHSTHSEAFVIKLRYSGPTNHGNPDKVFNSIVSVKIVRQHLMEGVEIPE